MQKKVKPQLKIREGKKKVNIDSYVLKMDEMFTKFMTAKKTEGLAPRTIDRVNVFNWKVNDKIKKNS